MHVNTIAFEGPNRAGKGTQIALLAERCARLCIPHFTIRGDGGRTADGVPGNPRSKWWDKENITLYTSATIQDWHVAAERIARELVVWRKRFQRLLYCEGQSGYLLLDRSLLSRAMICLEEAQRRLEEDELYPFRSGRPLNIEDLYPDIIFLLCLPKEELLSRLDQQDPKYDFRRELIERKFDWYEKYLDLCPEKVVARVVKLDGTLEPQEIHRQVVAHILRMDNRDKVAL